MKSPLLIFCLGPSRVSFLHPAARFSQVNLAQSAVPVPLSVSLWVPSAFPTGPSGADLLGSPHRRSPSGILSLIPWPGVPLQVASLIPLLRPVLGSPCSPAVFLGPLLILLSPFLSGSPRSPAVPLGVHSSPRRPCPHSGPLTLRDPSQGPQLTPHPGPSRSPGALAEPLATPLPGCSRPLRRDSGCHSGVRALTSALSPAAPASPPPLTRAPSRSRAGSSRAESPRAASARESPSRPTLHAGP